MSKRHQDYSVVIPFYKAEDYFPSTLYSVLDQSHLPREIIVVLDGRDIHETSYFDQFTTPLLELIVVETNKGAANARNLGVTSAQCEWIAFLDADDKWVKHKMYRQLEYLYENPHLDGCHTGVSVIRSGQILNSYTAKPLLLKEEHLVIRSQIVPTSFVVKRDLYMKLGGMSTDFKSSEDYDLSIRMVKSGCQIGFIPEPLSLLRRESHGNLSAAGWKTLRYHLKLLIKHRDMFFRNGGLRAMSLFLSLSLSESGNKLGGVQGKLLKFLARVLST